MADDDSLTLGPCMQAQQQTILHGDRHMVDDDSLTIGPWVQAQQ